jgi:SAM-dependent methyltransferase
MVGQTVREILLSSPLQSRRVIELGCGSGNGLFETIDVCTEIKEVHWCGLDLNLLAIQTGECRSRFRKTERNAQPVPFPTADLNCLPFSNESFDILLCAEVLEHMLEPKKVIEEMARILKPGGYALMTTPNPNNLIERLGYAIDKISQGALKRRYWSGYDQVSAPPLEAEVGFGHVSVHPYRIWRTWLEGAGLRVVRKVCGPMLFGGPFFDRWRFISGCMIALDPLLDVLPGRFLFSNNLGILCRKSGNSKP